MYAIYIIHKMTSFYYHFDHLFETLSRPVYYTLITLFYTIYFATLFGVAYVNTKYLEIMNTGIHIFVGLMLIIRFNPFRNFKCNENDQLFIFASASLLLLSTGITRTLENTTLNLIKKGTR